SAWGRVARRGVAVAVSRHLRCCARSVADTCAGGGRSAAEVWSRQDRVEVGVRQALHFSLARPWVPDLLAHLQYGEHAFSIARATDPAVGAGPPDVHYRFLSLGAGARLQIMSRAVVAATLAVEIPFTSGPIQS